MQTLPTPPYHHRYPLDIGKQAQTSLPFITFMAKSGRHIGRNQLIGSESNSTEFTVAACTLYLPPEALKSAQDIRWEGADYGTAIGGAIESGTFTAQKAKSMMHKLVGTAAADSETTAAQDALAMLKGAGNLLGSLAVGGLLESITESGLVPEKVLNAGSGVSGLRLNPRTDMLYQSVDFRTHEMSFKFIPRDKKEAMAIDDILNMFSYYSLPDFGQATGTNFFIGYPYEFQIVMFSQTAGYGAHHINTIERSVLTHLDVDHAAADRTSFIQDNGDPDYYPTVTTLNMTFKEIRLPGRDARGDRLGGGNIVLRGPTNASGYPILDRTKLRDPRGDELAQDNQQSTPPTEVNAAGQPQQQTPQNIGAAPARAPIAGRGSGIFRNGG